MAETSTADHTLPYFAYGSNLHVPELLSRCPGARADVAARLAGWQLVFRSVADIEPAEGSIVHGALWWLSAADLRRLDGYEGAPRHYRRRRVSVETSRGSCDAIAYVMVDRERREGPPASYLERIRSGFGGWGLPEEALERAVAISRSGRSQPSSTEFPPRDRESMQRADSP